MRTLLFFLLTPLLTLGQQPEIRINPGGHMAQIRDLEVSSDGKYAFSASLDKSIKQWDLASGRVVQEFRGEIGYGAEGMVYEIAVNQTNELLAAGGWFGKDDESEVLGDIRLYDIQNGKILHVFKGLENIPAEIKFLSDGKLLMAADQSSSIFVWDVETKKLIADLKYHSKNYGEGLYEAAADGEHIISVDELGNLALWKLGKDEPIAVNTKTYKKQLNYINASLSISEEKEEIAISADNTIYFYDFKLKEIGSIDLSFHPGFIEYDKSGDLLFHGNVGSGGQNDCYLWERNGRSWKEAGRFVGHQDAVLAGKIISKDHFVTGGGLKDEIKIWKRTNDSIKNTSTYQGNGRSFYGVSVSDQNLALASKWNKQYGFSSFNKTFDLFLKQFKPADNKVKFARAYHKDDNYSLSTFDEGNGVHRNSQLFISKQNKPSDTITREWWFGDRHNCFTLIPEEYIISGGAQGVMEAYNMKGFAVSNFVGHESDIWSIGFNTDTTVMVTCAADQTVRFWDLSEVGKKQSNYPPYTIEEYCKKMDIWGPFKQLFLQAKILDLTSIKTFEAWKVAVEVFKRYNYPYQLMEKKYYDFQYNTIYPKLSMYIDENGEWVIWNNSGYFTASLKGAKNVGFHVNRGQNKAANFYPFEQFDLKYNRPDIILDELDMGFEEYIPLYKKAYEKRLERMGYAIEDLTSEFNAPELSIYETKRIKDKLLIRIKADDENLEIHKLNVFNNDVPVFGRKGLSIMPTDHLDTIIKIQLASGQNKISLNVENVNGIKSLNAYESKFYSNQAQTCDLYIVTLGVSNYENESFNLKYAAKDANDVMSFFGESKDYRAIHKMTLIDHQVTKAVLDSIESFISASTVNDVLVFFIAGHGLLDKDYNYIYATHDIDFDDPSVKGISFNELEELLDAAKSHRKLLLMDTCHSGEVDKDEVDQITETTVDIDNIQFRSIGRNTSIQKVKKGAISEMSKSLFLDLRKGTGTTVISSAGGVEFAFESSAWNNGLFTYCLINNIKNQKSDLNNDRSVSVSELRNILQEEVYRLSKGFQKPTMRLSNISADFSVWRY
tara:strand:+ start:81612 stop:84797 length:3186 start_codon:yes stop_codon:yes gene_type:complete